MATIRNFDKRTGTTYIYEQHGVYDRQTHKTKHVRKLIGKLDAEGNIVPTGKKGRRKKKSVSDAEGAQTEPTIDYKELYESIVKDNNLKEERIQSLLSELATERAARKECESILRQMMAIGKSYA